MTTEGHSDREFQVLDGLRGIAAILVVGWHGGSLVTPGTTPLSGYLAVDLFFALSGFVIAFAYERRFAKGMDVIDFSVVRIIRFYPLFFAGLLIGALFYLVGNLSGVEATTARDWLLFGKQFLFLPSEAGDDAYYPWNPPAWSLAAELFINIVYVATWRWLTLPRLVAVVGVSSVLLTGLIVFGGSAMKDGWAWGQEAMFFTRVTFGFYAGVLIYRLHVRGWRLPRVAGQFLLVALAVLLWPNVGARWRDGYDLIFVLGLSPAIVCLGASASARGWVHLLAKYAGECSYAVYILHFPILRMIRTTDSVFLNGVLQQLSPFSGWTLVAILLPGCWALTRFYDEPVRRRLMDWWKARRPSAARPASSRP